jgi:cation/acetate symporter
MMIGTASLPHILMRYFTTPTVRDARNSVAWSLFFIFLLYFSAPALATFSKLSMLDPTLPTAIIGQPIEEVLALSWIQNWSEIGLLRVIDQNGDGILQINEFFLNPDIIVLGNAGNGRSALRDLRSGRRWRYGCGHVDRRRSAARHGQRPVA